MELDVERQFSDAILDQLSDAFGVQAERKPLGDFENYVFSARDKAGTGRVLRLTHSSHRSRRQIEEEISFLNHLAKNGVSVARAWPSQRGIFVEGARVGDDWFWGSLFDFAPGAHVGPRHELWGSSLFYTWGKAIGRMHALSVGYPKSLSRPHWKDDSLMIGQWLDDDLREQGEEVLRAVARLEEESCAFGLIHSDVHQGNFFYDGKIVHIFDFDDVMYHYFIHDLAIVIYYSLARRFDLSEEAREKEARLQLADLRRGYETEFRLEEKWFDMIPLFLKLRDVLLHCVFKKKFAGKPLPDHWVQQVGSIRQRIAEGRPMVNFEPPSLPG